MLGSIGYGSKIKMRNPFFCSFSSCSYGRDFNKNTRFVNLH